MTTCEEIKVLPGNLRPTLVWNYDGVQVYSKGPDMLMTQKDGGDWHERPGHIKILKITYNDGAVKYQISARDFVVAEFKEVKPNE